MRVQFVGQKTKLVGKTLWEIVGNLKNFGVGRLIKTSSSVLCENVSFFRILKIQPLPPSKIEFEDRKVIVWKDEIYNGRRLPVKSVIKNTDLAKYQLIPKIEEEEYLEKEKAMTLPKKYIQKYCFCPPLYKLLWEQENSGKQQMPKLKTVCHEYTGYEVIVEEKEIEPNTCSLYKDMTVDEMYKEIVRLKKIIKANTDLQQ